MGKKRFLLNKINELKSYIDNFYFSDHKFSKKIVVSLTTFGPRIPTVHYAIMSILAQTKIPHKIFLYIYKNEKISDELNNLQKKFSKIFFIKKINIDMRSYKKLLPALNDKDAKNYNIVTIDDDNIYNENLISTFEKYIALYPSCVIGNKCHSVKKIGCTKYYKTFLNLNDRGEKSKDLFFLGGGGILYPPHCFKKKILKYSEAQVLCPSQDDIYFWVYEKLNGIRRIAFKNELPYIEMDSLIKHNKKLFSKNRIGGNNLALKNIFTKFPDIATLVT